MCQDTGERIGFKLGMMRNTTKLNSFFESLNGLGVHSRPERYGKARTCIYIYIYIYIYILF